MRFIFLSKVAILSAISYFFIACSGNRELDAAPQDSVSPAEAASTTDQPKQEVPDLLKRKFIRTANLRCKVKDVRKSSEQIEDLVIIYKGFVTRSELQSNTLQEKTVPVSSDSLLQINSVRIESEIALRIPDRNLESLLKDLNSLMLYVDKRTIKADDVSLNLLSNDLVEKRLNSFTERVHEIHKNRGGNILTTTKAEDIVLNNQLTADEHKMQRISLQDRVDYSTVTINLYQNVFLHKEMLENTEKIENYRGGIFLRIQDSVKTGWVFFGDLLVLLIRLWVFLLIALLVFIYWRFKNKDSSLPINNGIKSNS